MNNIKVDLVLAFIEHELDRVNDQLQISDTETHNAENTKEEVDYAIGARAAYEDATYSLRRIHTLVQRAVAETPAVLAEPEPSRLPRE